MALAVLLAAPVAAADPLPVRDPGDGASTPTPTSPQVATQSSTAFADGDVFVAVGGDKVL